MSDQASDSNETVANSSAPKELPPPPNFDSKTEFDPKAKPGNGVGCVLLGAVLVALVFVTILGSLPMLTYQIFMP